MFEQLTQRVIAIIATNQNIPPEQISLESSFKELDIDSLAALSIIADLEDEFNISIPNEEALLISNVRQVVENLQKVLSQDSTDTEVTVQREWSEAEIFQ
jgi:acyl carrier protein